MEMRCKMMLHYFWAALAGFPLSLLRRLVRPLEDFRAGVDGLIAVELTQHLHRYSSGLVHQLEKDEEPQKRERERVRRSQFHCWHDGFFRFCRKRFSEKRRRM